MQLALSGHSDVNWRVSESAGIAIYLADFKGKRVVWEASLPYVTIDHQRQNLSVDEDGTESHGPFWMPLGLRSLVGSPRINQFRGGFELVADFETGPYRYTQLWRFHDDGRIAPLLTIYGNGLHDGHTYHPHWRFDFDIHGVDNDAVEHFEGGSWQRVSEEGWYPYGNEADDDGAVWLQPHRGLQLSQRPVEVLGIAHAAEALDQRQRGVVSRRGAPRGPIADYATGR